VDFVDVAVDKVTHFAAGDTEEIVAGEGEVGSVLDGEVMDDGVVDFTGEVEKCRVCEERLRG